jgi:starch synthase
MSPSSKKQPVNNIWMVSREYEGVAGSGGVKDVCCQLAEALAGSGKQISVVLPLYGFMNPCTLGFELINLSFEVNMNYEREDRKEKVTIWSQQKNDVTIYLADSERYREKQGIYTYTAEEEAKEPINRQGSAYHDYFAMNILLQKVALGLIIRLGEQPDIIHCHDGHTAILPAMVREQDGFRHYFRKTGLLLTIHNAGHGFHQEVDDLGFARAICELSNQVIHKNLLDGRFDPLLAASPYAVINTVSSNYARELRETNDDGMTGWLGHRLLARGVTLEGITNGINPGDYDPAHSKKLGLTASYNPGKGELSGKRKCKETMLRALGYNSRSRAAACPENIAIKRHGWLNLKTEQPLFILIARLTHQKGIDIFCKALRNLLPKNKEFQVLVLGDGSKEYENEIISLTADKLFKGRVCLLQGYDNKVANRVYAAGDFLLLPSRFEPCGLTDYIAQLFGTLPIVHHVGGLVKVVDNKTGLAFKKLTPENLSRTMTRAIKLYKQKPEKILAMQQEAVLVIKKKYTWETVREEYLKLYQKSLDMIQ